MKAREIFENLSYENNRQLNQDITNLILKYETKLTKKLILHDIDVRNRQGEGLMSPHILSLHVQDKLVDDDIVFYITLNKTLSYFSKNLNQNFSIQKLVLIVVNPQHTIDHLSKLEEFVIQEGRIGNEN